MDNTNRSSLGTYVLSILTLIFSITLLSAVLFYFFEYGHNPNVKSLWDCFWWAMVTMSTIGYGDIFPITLGGRIVAIFVMFAGIGTLGVSTAGIAAYFVKTDQFEEIRVRRMKDHIVICGLGDKGLLLTKAFRDLHIPVIVIEKEETNDSLAACREMGAVVFIGDATEPEMLTRAKVNFAKHLIAVCGSDGVNAEIAAHAREMEITNSNHVLTCAAHIVDPELWYLLRRWELASGDAFRLQFFNVYDSGARALLTAYPPFDDRDEHTTHPPHVVVVGAGRLGQSVVIHTARLWRDHPHHHVHRLKVTVVDADTSNITELLRIRHPGFERVCDIEPVSMHLSDPQFHHATFLFDSSDHCTATCIYVCVEDDTQGLSAALALLHRVNRHNVPVIVRMTKNAGLAKLLRSVHDADHGFSGLHAFGLLERTCQPDLVLGGTNEILARAIHEKYLAEQTKSGLPADGSANPAIAPWEKLPEDIKEANRRQADHIGLKLKSIGCDIAPLTEWDAESFTFKSEEVESMARMEHERWLADRRSKGWSYGPRDPQKKMNPNIVPWDQLPEEAKQFNRDDILALPDTLAHAGFQIYRLR